MKRSRCADPSPGAAAPFTPASRSRAAFDHFKFYLCVSGFHTDACPVRIISCLGRYYRTLGHQGGFCRVSWDPFPEVSIACISWYKRPTSEWCRAVSRTRDSSFIGGKFWLILVGCRNLHEFCWPVCDPHGEQPAVCAFHPCCWAAGYRPSSFSHTNWSTEAASVGFAFDRAALV